MSTEIDAFDDMVNVERFLEYVRGGSGPLNAAIAVGWTPYQIRQRLKDDQFATLVEEVKERRTETIEQVVYEKAAEGTRWAVEMYLFCQAPERGWRPPATRIDVTKTQRVEGQLVVSVVEGARQLLEAHSVAALQPGGALDGPIEDAEIVDDGSQ